MLTLAGMSASSFIEPFDAQMLDFVNDVDVPMNMAGSSEIFADASMEPENETHGSLHADNESVEVDMDTYDEGENAEYEMVDETADTIHITEEPLDIEVYDASHSHISQPGVGALDASPKPTHPSSPIISNTLDPLLTERISSDGYEPLPVTDSAPIASVSVDYNAKALSHQHHLPSIVEPQGYAADPTISVSRDSSPREISSPEAHPLAVNRTQISSSEQPGDVSSTVLHDDISIQLHPNPENREHLQNSLPQLPQDSPLPIAQDLGSTDAEPSSGVYAANIENTDPATSITVPSTLETHTGNAFDVVSPNLGFVAASHEEGIAHENPADPHEISDGVYIEPPPAVLVTLLTANEPEFCLFNQPQSTSQWWITSKDAEESEVEQKILPLLLQQQPTLYYEPLSSVFDALRQEEVIARIPGAVEAELIIDAYDLQLVVSEDNIYGREISLHDLNVLHDGSDLAGPLRIQLRSSEPRFILRYHLLQDQISRLNLATDPTNEDNQEDVQNNATNGLHETECIPQDRSGSHKPDIQTDTSDSQPEGAGQDFATLDEDGAPTGDDRFHQLHETDARITESEGGYHYTNQSEEAPEENPSTGQIDNLKATNGDNSTSIISKQIRSGAESTGYQDNTEQVVNDKRHSDTFPEEEENHYDADVCVDTVGEEGDGETGPSTALYNNPEAFLDPDSQQDAVREASGSYHEPDEDELGPDTELREDFDQSSFDLASASGSYSEPKYQDQCAVSRPTEEDLTNEWDVAPLSEREADSRSVSSTADPQPSEIVVAPPEYDENWDWDPDAEGEPDDDWEDPDAVSNESSATLSSKASSKRPHDEVDFDAEEDFLGDPPSSPESKRLRVQ
ncbi:hypothetical protein BJ138DRAFT_1153488 [Hygrophoropsis aurantiaca]|uniref:Uncharacterized protein n=1 Tax=Hygrophoropsis aurantiaca TaxID=72124 RepID=A0ACB8AAS9_9AGAM|nr:hypothetical protein BJ138DRAFT_1153488 [Hygrophoropsis aurantiaca]